MKILTALRRLITRRVETRTLVSLDLAENCGHWTAWMVEMDGEDDRDPALEMSEEQWAQHHPLDVYDDLALCDLSQQGEVVEYRCPRDGEWHDASDLRTCEELAARRPAKAAR
ncbi:hypothetical protein [Rathayibacter sp. VKM Ac-2630]|uniref:hypothetical protein n=1 Tax=Rathayibacter sp. VKM Ac-2630 TaxID=1938617 RepID=UPI0009813E61|nr:hypothetical protein [Rathayibacter sp. VKM Ac-2630]OOB90313.1 hypothetical protein B0T42_12495 [Rathayibacter sp. VKM Ac-2630]